MEAIIILHINNVLHLVFQAFLIKLVAEQIPFDLLHNQYFGLFDFSKNYLSLDLWVLSAALQDHVSIVCTLIVHHKHQFLFVIYD